MKTVLTIILMKNGKNIKTTIMETKQQLIGKDEHTETLKIYGTARNAYLQ